MNGGARRRGATERLIGERFTDVQNGVVQEAAPVDIRRRRGGINRDGTAVGRRVLRRVARGCRHGVSAILKACQRRRGHRHAPLAVCAGGAGISHIVKHDADDGARREIGGGTGNIERLPALLAVDDVIACDGVQRHLRLRARLGCEGHRVLHKRLVARGVGDRHTDGLLSVSHLRQRRGGHGHAPGAVRLHLARVGLPVEGNGHRLARLHARRGAGNLQRRLRLRGVDKVIGRDGIHRHQRRVGLRRIQRQRHFFA